ncbi:MAG: integral rane sensor signal transduction histidine kinase [Bacteroidetes bacterium]|nr:integral rane sensor signal transduction histidine kinase [Bacteroidota bacterium]
MKLFSTYTRKQIWFLFLVFAAFILIVLYSEYHLEKRYHIKALNKELNGYSELIHNCIVSDSLYKNDSIQGMEYVTGIIPDTNLRISIIDYNGRVLYDSDIKNSLSLKSHFLRPEIQQAISDSTGTDIRVSASTGIKYYYFARRFPEYFIRLSVVYDREARYLIEPDQNSLLFILLLFILTSLSLIVLTARLGKSISALKKFTLQASENNSIDNTLTFPKTELGNIGQDIVDIFQKLNSTKQELLSEKEKLVHHLTILEEGIAIFSQDKKGIASNSNFIQYINHISDKLVYSAENFFSIEEFAPIIGFIDSQLAAQKSEKTGQPSYEVSITKNGKHYAVKCIVFHDNSFEIILNDITKLAKRKLLKQQITENIAHELKTPVSSIKGFLETVLNNKIDRTKLLDYIQRAYSQTCRLADLINDISLLTKIEEAGNLYAIEKVNVHEVVSSVMEDLLEKLKENKIEVRMNITNDIELQGNSVLLYSAFRNLLENVLHHAGTDVMVTIDKYMEDQHHYYFSFSDTGSGVPEQDIPRLFERFYRVDKGRDRKSGGTGLGLSIVKNAILFHQGDISVKNRKEGGLEFLFSLGKNLQT